MIPQLNGKSWLDCDWQLLCEIISVSAFCEGWTCRSQTYLGNWNIESPSALQKSTNSRKEPTSFYCGKWSSDLSYFTVVLWIHAYIFKCFVCDRSHSGPEADEARILWPLLYHVVGWTPMQNTCWHAGHLIKLKYYSTMSRILMTNVVIVSHAYL